MLERLLGLETEYAIRFSKDADCREHPGNRRFYDAIANALRARVTTRKKGGIDLDEQEFLENGAALSFEHLPYSGGRFGLCEGSTPECASPADVLLYQRALDELLKESTERAELSLAAEGISGKLRLLKNCRDADGEIYGVQENLEVEFASGFWLLAWRAGWAILLPWSIIWSLVFIALLLSLMLLALVLSPIIFSLVYFVRHQDSQELRSRFNNFREGPFPKIARRFDVILSGPSTMPIVWWLAFCGFRKQRKRMSAFLVSRALITGAGTLDADGEFALGEKSEKINQVMRRGLFGAFAIIDTGNLITDAAGIAFFSLSGARQLFNQHQRMQLGLADANLCDVAEYLKIGTTALVADWVESGDRDHIALKDPVAALKIWRRNPLTKVKSSAGDVSAYDVQRYYLDAVSRLIQNEDVPSLEAKQITELWRGVLDILEDPNAERHALSGRLDWVTKRFLLETSGEGLSKEARKKIDLCYHELGSGYFAALQREGHCTSLLDDDEVLRAINEPPENSPARLRAQLIKSLEWEDANVYMSWSKARVKRDGQSAQIFHFQDRHRPNTHHQKKKD